MSHVMLDRVQNQVLQAIDLSAQAQHLNSISHLLNCRIRVAELMPVVGSLVTAGYLQKVAPPTSSSGPLHARSRPSGPVHFQLTELGRRHLLTLPSQLKATMQAPPGRHADGADGVDVDERDFRIDDGDDALDATSDR